MYTNVYTEVQFVTFSEKNLGKHRYIVSQMKMIKMHVLSSNVILYSIRKVIVVLVVVAVVMA